MGDKQPVTYQWLGHHDGDDVGVAVVDIEPGTAKGVFQDSGREDELTVNEPVPLGHKVALQDLAEGQDLIKYGIRVGLTTKPIKAGDHVHVHNVGSARWQAS